MVAGAGAEVAKRFGKCLLCAIAARLVIKAVDNKIHGKTLLGQEKEHKPEKKTRVDWQGNVVLGTDDYKIIEG